MTATLSDVPKSPHELEDYVAALFQSAGYFVEKKITERDFTEILELDAVATSYGGTLPASVLVEAKSGDWGFPDIFKVAGWMRYLDIERGAFFVSKQISDRDPELVNRKIEPLGVSLVLLGDFSDAVGRFSAAGFPKVEDPILMAIWRFAYWIERKLIDNLRTIAKSNPSRKGPWAAMRYHRLVNDGIFFVKDVRERLSALYDAYRHHPKLSLGVALEIAGGEYDPEAIDPSNPLIRQAMIHGSHDLLQSCFYVEHRARLAILKAAIDYGCLSDQGAYPRGEEGEIDFSDPLLSLPATFHRGLNELKREPFFKLYALFWQVFLWGLGGFYLEDRKAMEFEWLSRQTGISAEEIPRALRVFDVLFPVSGSWIARIGPSQCTIAKMVPTPFRGLGAFHRRLRYGLKDYSDLGYGDYTVKDLTKWNNVAVTLLTS